MSLTTGVETFNNACLARLRGRARASSLFLIRLTLLLMLCLTALAPDLTVLEMDDDDTVDRSEDCDDFAEVFVDIKRVKKK